MNSGSTGQVTTLPAVSWTTPPPPMTDRFRWFCSQACTNPRLTPASVAVPSGGWGEELERDAVRVAEAQARAVAGVLDLAVGDAQLVQPAGPLLQLGPVGAAEGDVVQADPELAEAPLGRRRPVLVQAEQGVVAEQVHGVVEVGVGVLVQHRLGLQQRLVPGDADRQVADAEGDVGEGRKVGHGPPWSGRDAAAKPAASVAFAKPPYALDGYGIRPNCMSSVTWS